MSDQQVDLTKERELRCVPIAQAVVKLLAENPKMGDIAINELTADYKETAKKTIELLMASDASIADINYIFQLVRQPAEALQSVITDTFTAHLETIQKNKFGNVMGELKVVDLHKMLVDDTLK